MPAMEQIAEAASLAEEDAENTTAGDSYTSFDIEATDEERTMPGRWRWHGRIFVYNVGGRIVFIGPHWYCSIIMLAFILGVGSFHCSQSYQTDTQQFLVGICVTLLSVLSFLRCALANPGILLRSPPEALEALRAEESLAGVDTSSGEPRPSVPVRRRWDKRAGRECGTCKLVQPKGCVHCQFCKVCIEGHDHHCPWMGKCIGAKNLHAFYTFLVVSFSSLGYVFVCALLFTPSYSHQGSTPAVHHANRSVAPAALPLQE
eukprot:TRINITY_DN43345_c0_g1_i1.p1 TRINITY_DN43345_c0_g1~~TRINITY_DN43345_c0_g1_i1.p1  ORF type:complete len:260 (-),score=14.70 TRINITY_DN43345_c0_g1_i1:93-872(-)